jgi:hypothetical protein
MSKKIIKTIPCDLIPEGTILAAGPNAISTHPDFIQIKDIESERKDGKVRFSIGVNLDPNKIYINPNQIALLKCTPSKPSS